MPDFKRDWRPSPDGDTFPTYTKAASRADHLVHLVGLALATMAIGWLLGSTVPNGTDKQIVAVSIYCFGLAGMLSASAAYHLVHPSHLKRTLRRLDHAMIFAMIAGSYTPFMMSVLRPDLGMLMIGVVWGLAALGIGLKLFCGHQGARLSLSLYLGMGWLGLAILRPLLAVLPRVDLLLLLTGGLIYSLGAIVHARARMPFHNAVWHTMVVVAAALHFVAVARLLSA